MSCNIISIYHAMLTFHINLWILILFGRKITVEEVKKFVINKNEFIKFNGVEISRPNQTNMLVNSIFDAVSVLNNEKPNSSV